MTPTAYLLAALGIWGLIGPAGAYTYSWLVTRANERAACTIRVAAEVRRVADKINADAEAKIAAAEEAVAALTPTPETKAELSKLCQGDPMCREHKP